MTPLSLQCMAQTYPYEGLRTIKIACTSVATTTRSAALSKNEFVVVVKSTEAAQRNMRAMNCSVFRPKCLQFIKCILSKVVVRNLASYCSLRLFFVVVNKLLLCSGTQGAHPISYGHLLHER